MSGPVFLAHATYQFDLSPFGVSLMAFRPKVLTASAAAHLPKIPRPALLATMAHTNCALPTARTRRGRMPAGSNRFSTSCPRSRVAENTSRV